MTLLEGAGDEEPPGRPVTSEMVSFWPLVILLASWTMGQIQLTQRNNHANISDLLDNLLRGYDNSVRPDFGGLLLIH